MRNSRKWQLAVVCLLALALLPFAPAPRGTAQAPGYTVTDLGTLGNGAGLSSRAFGLDECGRVVGESQAVAGEPAPFHPFYWDGTTLTDLGTLGGSTGLATALNQSGTVVGSSLTSGSLLHPFVRPPAGSMQDIGTLGGFSAEAQDINAVGQVVGQTEDGSFQDRAFVWQQGSGMHALTAPWGTPIRAYGINDAGQIAGSANLASSGTHAFVTIGGVAVDLGTLGGSVSVATRVNDLGEVSGYSYIFSNTISQSFHAFRWKDLNGNNQSDAGEMLDLGVLSGDKNSYAYDINNGGQVVGYSENGLPGNNNVTRAFIWTSANGMRSLNDVVPGTGWTFQEARGVNNRGQIVGTGLNPDGKVHAFLLTPTDVGPSPCDATPTPTPAPNPLQFTAATYTVAESGGSVVISVGRTGSTENTVTVNYATSNGTATQPGDYASASGTLTFGPGETTQTFSVNVVDDTLDESDETVNLTLSSPGPGAVLGPQSTATLTITDNDTQPTLQFSSAAYSVAENAGTATVTVTRTGGTNGGVTVNYATATGGTATAGSDYTATSGTLTFAEGETSKTFTVAVANDALDEANETVNLTLSSPSGGAVLGTQTTAVLTITDDDATPTLSVNDVTVTEGNTGTSPATTATFAVTLNGASAQTVTVNYATSDGTATQPGDYASAGGTVTFNPGETGSKNVTVSVVGDTADEPNETFNVNLSNVNSAATISDAQGVGTINDDDGTPSLNINDATVTEGNSGTTTATFTVSLLPASGQTVTVNYATSNGTATAESDYTANSNTLTFAPGDTSKTITVNVTGDTTPEPHETFSVTLSGAANASLAPADTVGLGTINNDDAALTVSDATAPEGNSGTTSFTFAVGFQFPTVNTVTVSYSTSDGTATAGSDYTAASGTLTFAAGETSKNVPVQVNGDTMFENSETFNVTLSGATSAAISDSTGLGTITNDDTAPAFSINDVTVTEGDAGTVNATFNVTLSAPSGLASSVNFATANGTAAAPGDYASTSGTLNFAAGQTSQSITVLVNGDTLFEGNETFVVNLTSAAGATIADTQGQGTITNDDTQPTLQFSSAAYSVAENGTMATITVTRTGGSNAVTVNYATSNGTATAGSDYTAASGTLTFAAGDNSETFTVAIANDALDEVNETVNLTLSSPSGGAVLGTQTTAVLTITDDDATPTLSVNDVTVTEGQGTASFNVTLSAASGQTVTVSYSTTDGTAVAPGDYTAVNSGTVTFNPGETSKPATVSIVNDALDEVNETFNVNLSSPTNATLNDGAGVGTITDDDAPPSLSINDLNSIPEVGNLVTFTVTLSAPSGQTVTVNYASADGTATAGSDYTAVVGTLTFNPGETTKGISVQTVSDNIDEADETFFVNLSGATNATIADAQGVGTLLDNDATPALSIDDVTVAEGSAGPTEATFTVTLAPGSGRTVTVNYATSDGTAVAGSDYTATSGTLTFAPGVVTKTVTVLVTGDTTNEPNETFAVVLSNPSNAFLLDANGQGTINNDDATSLRFSQAAYPVGESAHFVTITVTRTGDASLPVGVDFATSDGSATERRDYTAVSGNLQFAAGETSKTFDVLLTEDSYQEGLETINLTLSNPTGGASLGSQPTATVNIAADDTTQPQPNPIDESSNFVRQHYHDFLNREPDASGLAFWTGEIEQCGADTGCREVKRINVSAAFFLSIEFQQTGYLVYRTYKAAYGDATSPNVEGTVPVVRLQEFLPDTRRIGEGVVVGQPNWEQKLDANKNNYMSEFVLRQRFVTAFPLSMTAAQFVDKLNQNAGGVLTQGERDQLVASLAPNPAATAARANALRSVAENAALQQQEFTRAFVLMQYYGYLRRNPDDAPDTDFRGWKFWLQKLNESNGNFVNAEMVKAFLDSIEYRTRFAP